MTAPDEHGPQRPRRFDERGIALQTVIIMVVLLAIAGGVAAVLLTRGGEAANQLEQQEVTVDAADYKNESLCKAAGFFWGAEGTASDGGTTSGAADTCHPFEKQ